MQLDERDAAYLWDMRGHALLVIRLIEGASFADFGPDSMLRLAVERAIEIVGEAASRVSPDLREAHPEIAWRDIVGQRNILARQYGRIDPRRLWQTATHDLPELVQAIDRIIPRTGPSTSERP